jgi:hypothetical protein
MRRKRAVMSTGSVAFLAANVVAGVSHFINEPDHWRARAEEARNLANQMNDPESKDAMLRIADDYEHLANRAEHRAAGRLPNWMKPKGAMQ